MGGKAERRREGQSELRSGIVPRRFRKELGRVAATSSDVRTIADLFTKVYSVPNTAGQRQPNSPVQA